MINEMFESLGDWILTFATMDDIFRFGVGVAIIAGLLALYFVAKFGLYIKWEMHPIETGKCAGGALAFGIACILLACALTQPFPQLG